MGGVSANALGTVTIPTRKTPKIIGRSICLVIFYLINIPIKLIKIYIQYPRNHFMLSKREREYLSGNLKLSKNYEYKITHSIRNKIKTFYQLELPLLQNSNCAEESRREASRPDWLGKLTSCQSGLTPLNSSFEINII